MTDRAKPTPEDISIVRLHGEACFYCGAVNTTLHPAGNVKTDVAGGSRIWPIVACSEHRDLAEKYARIANHWLPADGSTRCIEAGIDWDAIQVSTRDGFGHHVLATLEDQSGPVVEDTQGHVLYWLVKSGTAHTWKEPNSEAFGNSCFIPIPWMHASGGLVWRVPVSTDGSYTDTDALRTALQTASGNDLAPATPRSDDREFPPPNAKLP